MDKISNGIWVQKGNTNVGLIEFDGNRYLIDTGSSEKFAKALLEEVGKVDFVFNTHSHADHIQGNHLFASEGARIYADEVEKVFIENPSMESFYLYGGNPPRALKASFFKAKSSIINSFQSEKWPSKIEFVQLNGHSPGMTGVKFENVLFCGDAYFGQNIIEKYAYPYLVDVKSFLDSMDKISKSNAEFYIPSHGDPTNDPSKDIMATKNALMDFVQVTLDALASPKSVEEVCFEIAHSKELHLNSGTFYLFRSFESSVISYLEELAEIVNVSYGKWQRK